MRKTDSFYTIERKEKLASIVLNSSTQIGWRKLYISSFLDREKEENLVFARRDVDFLGITCKIATAEDLILSKMKWYDMTKSEKQAGDIAFLLNLEDLDMQ